MAQKRLISLTESAIKTFTIHDFIYHIIWKGETRPEYLDEVILTKNQREFFRDIILEAARGTQYSFRDNKNSFVVTECSKITKDPSNNFVSSSKTLTEHFLYTHPTNALDGIIVISRITMEVNTETKNFIALLKIDYTKVLEQIRDKKKPGVVSFHEIVHSLSEDKKAIQKRALIDIDDSFEWDVIAVERNKVGQKIDTEDAISKYFRQFLDVSLKVNGSTCSRRLPSAVSRWAKTEELVDAIEAKAIVVAMIKASDGQSIMVDDIRDKVCARKSQAEYKKLKNSFDSFMDKEEYQLKGAQFVARSNSLAKKDEVTTLKTNYGVTISFEGSEKEAKVNRVKLESGQMKIEILADHVETND
ncbi:hypothetical protein GCM10009092_45850 [Bowmanella denitrificans]|uniref:Nucleoid-associated protein n=1 Tax=Bowmanella denitrificans TaxID=366582 RepID=A0ABN0XY73_9ALTE